MIEIPPEVWSATDTLASHQRGRCVHCEPSGYCRMVVWGFAVRRKWAAENQHRTLPEVRSIWSPGSQPPRASNAGRG